MTEWWATLPLELQVFYSIGIVAVVVTAVQLLMTMFGFGPDGADAGFDVEVGDVDHGTGMGMFSSQTLAAFFTAFGWVGVTAIRGGLSIVPAILVAFFFGALAMVAMYYMLMGLLRLQSKGNLLYDSAMGEEATVYVTVPADDRDGGQIQVTIQGRLTTASARTPGAEALVPGQRVRVVGMSGPTSFVVEALSSSSPTPTP